MFEIKQRTANRASWQMLESVKPLQTNHITVIVRVKTLPILCPVCLGGRLKG